MVIPGTRFRVALIPLSRIVVTEHQPRNPARVRFYHDLLAARPDAHVSMIHLAPYQPSDLAPDGGTKHTSAGLWQILDGHHRYVAHILAGRSHILALCVSEPGWPDHDAASADDGWMEVA